VNKIFGRVITEKSRQPVSNILVAIFDLDAKSRAESEPGLAAEGDFLVPDAAFPDEVLDSLGRLGDRLGSVITDQNGAFELEYEDAEFRVANAVEQRPDLFLILLAPESPKASAKDLLLFSSQEVRRNAGKREQFLIRLPESLLKEKGIPFGAAAADETTAARVEDYSRRQSEDKEYIAKTQRSRAADINATLAEFQETKRTLLGNMARPAVSMPALSTRLEAERKVSDVLPEHHVKQVGSINQMLDDVRAIQGGIEVSFVLDQAQRSAIGVDVASAAKLSLTDTQLAQIRSRMNFAGLDNLVLTSQNPILRYCLDRPLEVQQQVEVLFPPPNPAPFPVPPPPPAGVAGEALTAGNIDAMLGQLFAEHERGTEGYKPPMKADATAVNQNVDRVSLSKGPAEQTAYYDFSVLNIAFGHVWKQVIDTTPASVAATVAGEIKRFGVTLPLTSLTGLLATAYDVLRIDDPPPKVIAEFEITREEWAALTPPMRVRLEKIADDIGMANAGYAFDPDGRTRISLSGLTYEPPGFLRLPVPDAERLKSELRQQGEAILDYVRSTNVRSLHGLLRDLDISLKSKHDFTVFGADETAKSVNFGLLNTYRQRWEPISYQVGDLVRSVPMAPREERKYNVKQVIKTKRSEKESRKNNSTVVQDITSTGRSEEEIVNRAQSKVNFNLNGAYSSGGWSVSTALGMDAQKESQQNRKSFREAVMKATQEYKSERSIDITVEMDSEVETQESGTISNPNDELAVTYLFYELQKRFKVSEQLFRTLPVVLVAQTVPDPEGITDAWIVAHDWILNRVLLDDSFRAALQRLGERNVGDDFAVRELRRNLRIQRATVELLRRELAAGRAAADNRYRALERQISVRVDAESEDRGDGFWENVSEAFGGADSDPEAAKARELAARDAHQYALEKSEKASAALQRELHQLGQATEDFSKAYRDHLDKIAAVSRLKAHVKDNLIHYLQAIWSHENEDQRLMRLLGTEVPDLQFDTLACELQQSPVANDLFKPFRAEDESLHKAWIRPQLKLLPTPRPLEEVADLSRMLGYVGNYMVFPMKRHNALTEVMAMPYVDASFGAMDPDQLSNISLEDYARYVKRLREELTPADFAALSVSLKAWLQLLLADPLRNGDQIVVPTNSLYIEVMASDHTLMEEFKLQHRQLDVEKARNENLDRRIETLRKAKRIVTGELDDPSVDKRISIEPGVGNGIVVGPDPA
jgi:hypothetical protein